MTYIQGQTLPSPGCWEIGVLMAAPDGFRTSGASTPLDGLFPQLANVTGTELFQKRRGAAGAGPSGAAINTANFPTSW